jgi:hypothetical protein
MQELEVYSMIGREGFTRFPNLGLAVRLTRMRH